MIVRDKLAQITAHPKYGRASHWAKAIAITGGAQVLVQATGLLTGILIIRMLTDREYAYYTLANTMLGTMTILADGGISSGVMAQGGKVWNDKQRLGTVLATGLYLRQRFAIGSLLVAVPALVYMLWHHGAGPLSISLITLALIPAFFAALSDSLLEISPKLHQDIKPLQKNQALVSIGRLLLSVVSLFIFPFTYVAILAYGIPRIWGNFRLRTIARKTADISGHPDKKIRNEILRIVRRRMPESIYYCLSGQITIWLISLFGSTASLASLGAIGRLGMTIFVFSVVFNTLFAPRFARLPDVRKVLSRFVTYVLIGSIFLSLFIVGVSWLFSSQILWILGKQYAGLRHELVLSMIGACLNMVMGYFFILTTSRGWVINPILYITISMASVLLSLLVVSPSTLSGVLIFNIIVAGVQSLTLIFYSYYKIRKVN